MKSHFSQLNLTSVQYIMFSFFTLVLSFRPSSHAYVLPLDSVLRKNVQLAGNSIISVHQNLQFEINGKPYLIKEIWLIEGDKNLKLVATGEGDLKGKFKAVHIYNGTTRTSLSGKNKITSDVSRDFFERILAIKSKDSYMAYLGQLGISPNIRLSRAVGEISFAVGAMSTEVDFAPQLWFSQESFQLLKIRLPSGAEVEFEDYNEYKNGLQYPVTKTLYWDETKEVNISVQSVTAEGSSSLKDFYPSMLDQPSYSYAPEQSELGLFLEEFYKRFR